ncbi:hypothetical protein BGW41_003432 [Actinomortierella wolfii]|nr:hypothetical protein BGW41_003432 [Actinomortierella wolfii]
MAFHPAIRQPYKAPSGDSSVRCATCVSMRKVRFKSPSLLIVFGPGKRAFVVSPKEVPPPINLVAGDQTSDRYFQPRRVFLKKPLKAHFIKETLFVYGHHSSVQFSHWLYNGVMPLQTTVDNIASQKEWEMDDLFPPSHITENGQRVYSNRELVLNPEEVTSDFQTLPPKDAPICFERAVIGLGSQCPFNYCEQNIPSSIYTDYQKSISSYYWPTRARWIEYTLTRHRGIEAWKDSQGWGWYEEPLDNLEEQQAINAAIFLERNEGTPMQCLWNTMYFNFEEDPSREFRMWVDPLLRHSQEPLSRLGIADPDRIYRKKELESEEATTQEMQTDARTKGTGGSDSGNLDRRKIVVAIVQREQSRTLINIDELTQHLISEGYRIKRITFDHGCGIPQMAYLLRDVDLLISPYGDSLGASIFLPRKPHVTTVSIDSSYAPENRFIWTTVAIGQRYLQHHFGPDFRAVARANIEREQKQAKADGNGKENRTASKSNNAMDKLVAAELARLQTRYPLVRDMRLARKIRDQIWGQSGHQYRKVAAKLNYDDLRQLMTLEPQQNARLVRKMGGAQVVEAFKLEYWRASARYVDVDQVSRIAALIDRESRELAKGHLSTDSTRADTPLKSDIASKNSKNSSATSNAISKQRVPYTYLDLCRENRCCGNGCESILHRVLVGNQAAHDMNTEPGPEWGYYRGSDGVLRRQKTAHDMASEYGPGQLLDWKLEL